METMETVSKICIFAATNQVEGFKQELALHPVSQHSLHADYV